MSAVAAPSVSVVIVAHDSLADLRRSLPALVGQLADDDELIVVDNASRDGLRDELAQLAPGARLLSLTGNSGFAGGVNAGARLAGGDLLVLLNPDAIAVDGFLEAIRTPWAGEWAAWMGLVLMHDGEAINTSGGVLHFTGFGWAGQVGEPAAMAPSRPREVAFLSGACLAIPRRTWIEVGGFEEWFFMYCEDVDLSLRLRLRGGRVAVVPQARVVHDYAFEKGDYKWRWLERNRWATIVRTYPAALLAVVAPALFAAELAVWCKARREGWVGRKARASAGVVRTASRLWAQRRAIQATRTITVAQFAEALTPELSSPYLGAAGASPRVARALTAYWRAVRWIIARRPS